MKLYKISNAPPGERWHSSKTGLKDFIEVELPKEGRAGMAVFLNDGERELLEPVGRHNWTKPLGGDPTVVGAPDDLEAAELRAVAAAQVTTMSGLIKYDYSSPFSARTILADIDAGTCVQAVKQFDGPNLGKVVAACVERISQLLDAVPGAKETSSGVR